MQVPGEESITELGEPYEEYYEEEEEEEEVEEDLDEEQQ